MSTYKVEPDVTIGRVEGLSSSYGPGGFAVGTVGPLDAGRRETGGPIEPGPWGYLFGLASVIDNFGGTGAEHERARSEGRWLESVAEGDVLIVGDNVPMVLRVGPMGRLRLDPVELHTYEVSVTRVSYYEVPAASVEDAEDAALSGEYGEVGGETTSVVAALKVLPTWAETHPLHAPGAIHTTCPGCRGAR